jgi:hypothetical protein
MMSTEISTMSTILGTSYGSRENIALMPQTEMLDALMYSQLHGHVHS